jgi:hypothetical protein
VPITTYTTTVATIGAAGLTGALAKARRAIITKPLAILLAQHAKHDLAETFDRFGTGFAIGGGNQGALLFSQFTFKRLALFGQGQKTLAAILQTGSLVNETLANQLAQNA